VTREALDVARYIAGLTAKLEAVAIVARLDQLGYFLGMAKAESEIFVRTYGAPEAERAEEGSDEPGVGLHQEKNSFDWESMRSCFVGARAQGDAVGQIFDAP
jgi:hypothetical protein